MTNKPMRKSTKTILRVGAACLVVGLVCTILGTCLGGFQALDRVRIFGHTIQIGSPEVVEESVYTEPFKNIELDVTGYPVNVVPDSEYYVEYVSPVDAEAPVITNDGDTLKITANGPTVGAYIGVHGDDDPDIWHIDTGSYLYPVIVVHCPKDKTYGAVKIKLDMSSCSMSEIHAGTVDLDLTSSDIVMYTCAMDTLKLKAVSAQVGFEEIHTGVFTGSIEMSDLEWQRAIVKNKATLDAKEGDVSLQGHFNGTSDFKMDTGDLTITLDDPESEYDYTIAQKGADVEINDEESIRNVKNPKASNKMNISINYGDLDLYFGDYYEFEDED